MVKGPNHVLRGARDPFSAVVVAVLPLGPERRSPRNSEDREDEGGIWVRDLLVSPWENGGFPWEDNGFPLKNVGYGKW